jgi:hypothetical protein
MIISLLVIFVLLSFGLWLWMLEVQVDRDMARRRVEELEQEKRDSP